MVTTTSKDLIPEAFREIVLQRPLDARDLRSFPEDRNRYEIIGGQLIVSPSPSTRHQHVLIKLASALDTYLSLEGSGAVYAAPLDVRLSFYDVVQPDLLVVLDDRAEIVQEQGIVGAPNLVVEILSPSSNVTDRVDKAVLYARSGVPEYWIVDPIAETVTVHELDADRLIPTAQYKRADRLSSPTLSDFILDLDTIFPAAPPTSSTKNPVETTE